MQRTLCRATRRAVLAGSATVWTAVAAILALACGEARAGQILVCRQWDPDGAGTKLIGRDYSFRHAADESLMDIHYNANGIGDYSDVVAVYRPQDQRFYTAKGGTDRNLYYYDATAPAGGGSWNETYTVWTPSTNTRQLSGLNNALLGLHYNGGGCVDKDGNLYFVAPNNKTADDTGWGVVKVTFSGGTPAVAGLIAEANMPDPVSCQGYIAVDDDGFLYVTQGTTVKLVRKFNPDGTVHTASFISSALTWWTRGILYHDGHLYVTDGTRRIAKFDLSGTLLGATWGDDGNTGQVYTLATDGEHIYAAAGNGLFKFDLATGGTATPVQNGYGWIAYRALAAATPPAETATGTVIQVR